MVDFGALARAGLPAQGVGSPADPIPLGGLAQASKDALSKCSAYRVQLAGGHLLSLATHPSMIPVEEIYRKLPLDGVFTATPSKPFMIELGSYQVPPQMTLLMLDFRFDVYRFSGVAAGDYVPLENRRLSTVIGQSVLFSQARQASLRYEATPSLPSTSKEAFQAQPGSFSPTPQNQYDQVRFQNQQSPSGQGLSMLPNRHRRDAQLAMPFTYVVPSNQRVQLQTIIYQPVSIPLAFFEGEFSGLILSQNAFADFLASITPCSVPKGQTSP